MYVLDIHLSLQQEEGFSDFMVLGKHQREASLHFCLQLLL